MHQTSYTKRTKKPLLVRRVLGDNMTPTFAPGKMLVATPWVGHIRPRDIVIIEHEGLERVERVVGIKNNRFFVVADNRTRAIANKQYGWIDHSMIKAKVLQPKPARMLVPLLLILSIAGFVTYSGIKAGQNARTFNPISAIAESMPLKGLTLAISKAAGREPVSLSEVGYYTDVNSESTNTAMKPLDSITEDKVHGLKVNLFADTDIQAFGKADKIARQPHARWFGDWNTDIKANVAAVVNRAKTAGKTATLVAYNIPDRDCGSFSAGGAASQAAYEAWIQGFADGIGSGSAIVILEPDALAGYDCLSAELQSNRIAMLRNAVAILAALPNTHVYIDAGHPKWQSTTTMAARLQEVGVDKAAGFALNVSNFITTEDNVVYGRELAAKVENKHFVIDTSRNGNGPAPNDAWCNPSGRALGLPPTAYTSQPLVDALLWIKSPGESDGACGGAPKAGIWWQEYADSLVKNTRW